MGELAVIDPGTARLTYGLFLLVAPDELTDALTGRPLDGRTRAVARVLGARHLLQAALLNRTEATRSMGRFLDAVHAVTMLCIAVFDSRRRRLALIDTAVAGLFSLAGTSPRVGKREQPAPLVQANRQGASVGPAPEDDGFLLVANPRRRRRQALLTQRAICDTVDAAEGQPVEEVKRELVRALEVRGVSPMPEPWLDAVAEGAMLGNIYVVDEQALAATGRVLPQRASQ
jgi:hypothetical protein